MNIKVTIKSSKDLLIPEKGSLLMIANHPFGIIDGLIMCSLASKVRADFKIMTHETLRFAPELDKFILPIDFNENDKETIKKIFKQLKKQESI